MAVIPNTLSTSRPKQLRSFDAFRDLNAVADLIESGFSKTLDPDGRRYLSHMRAAARRKGVNRWTSLAASTNSLPLTGFVWEEDGKVVGNLSMVPFTLRGRRIYMIANVAVYPEYRRLGIAQALTAAALEKSRQRNVKTTWLQVRHDNQAAINLYLKMGFTAKARRTTWIANPGMLKGEAAPGVRILYCNPRHWSQQRSWLEQNYPPGLRWNFFLKTAALKPGILGAVYRFFCEVNLRQWAVERDQELLGVLSWQGSRRYADYLWLAAPPAHENLVLKTVLPFIRREHRLSRPIALDYPEGRAVDTLVDAGFDPKTTLVWMEVKQGQSNPVECKSKHIKE
jgi:ribosomal-protein-alanine N-acetyltransferase